MLQLNSQVLTFSLPKVSLRKCHWKCASGFVALQKCSDIAYEIIVYDPVPYYEYSNNTNEVHLFNVTFTLAACKCMVHL